ncbi:MULTISPECIES: hypothetical protein [Flavobacterium]|uniref:hypothetical protein n=1 Tax=Flavobacterium TaxID=237 RepID=UPI001FCAED5C|nr:MULTISPECIES: hypothetical protein [Flavobacterium]UOK41610.1 hypothetical protein LZF87_09835 [Flavobacterium enshiense]
MLKNFIVFNILISIFMFAFIFYRCAGMSGGDLAIIAFNIMFGIFQLISNNIYLSRFKPKMVFKVLFSIIIIQIIELIIFIIYGYQINEWIKSNYS